MNQSKASNLDQALQPAQEALFDGDFSPLPEDLGFRGPVACKAAGITYRQLDYWARTDLVTPEIRGAEGSGTQRLYSFRDILLLKVIKRLIDAGISLQQIRVAIDHLRERGVQDLTQVTLMSDGVSVYECTSDLEVVDRVYNYVIGNVNYDYGEAASVKSGYLPDVDEVLSTWASKVR